MHVTRLTDEYEHALEECLQQDPLGNLFLIGFLGSQPMEYGAWYGVTDEHEVFAVVLLVGDRLAVPWCPDPAHADLLGSWLRGRRRPCMMVGPREAVDRIWAQWAPDVVPRRFYDQRLYVLRHLPKAPAPDGFRLARTHEWPLIAEHAARMEFEDIGRDPSSDAELHARVVRNRIAEGKTWVLERDGDIVFQVNLGTAIPLGCQLGGTYVPPRFRGHGYSVLGMRGAVDRVLTRFPVVTLHVNENNAPAVRCYERVGFMPAAPYRLLTVGPAR